MMLSVRCSLRLMELETPACEPEPQTLPIQKCWLCFLLPGYFRWLYDGSVIRISPAAYPHSTWSQWGISQAPARAIGASIIIGIAIAPVAVPAAIAAIVATAPAIPVLHVFQHAELFGCLTDSLGRPR